MVTIASGPRPEPHRHRRMAESFGTDPERYDRNRPPYPQAVVDRVLAAAPGPRVLDVGCGTGILARQFRDAGRRVLGVEPDERMAAFARTTGIQVEVATFEDWDPAGRTFDAIVAGTAWHWVDPVTGAAKAARLLRSSGILAPFGHVYELPPALAEALAAALRRVAPDHPFGDNPAPGHIRDAYRGLYDKAAAGIRACGGFSEPEVWRHDWEHACTREELLDLVATSGALVSLPPQQARQVLNELRAASGEPEDARALPCTTWGLTAIRTGDQTGAHQR